LDFIGELQVKEQLYQEATGTLQELIELSVHMQTPRTERCGGRWAARRLDPERWRKVESIFDTGGPLGRAVVIIIGAIAELERNLIIERVRAGMRRARLEGRHIGRRPLEVDRVAVLRDRNRGDSLTDIAKTHRVSRATVSRLLKQAKDAVPVSI